MNLVQWLAVKFEEDKIDYTQWPEDAEEVTQDNCEVTIQGWEGPYGYKGRITDMCFDCEGDFKYIEEYDSGETISREEFFSFIEAKPTYAKDIIQKRKSVIGKISELNKAAYNAVEEAMKLSDEVGLPYTCPMPSGVADLDENSDWDSSRC
jgi:hypothetical protein